MLIKKIKLEHEVKRDVQESDGCKRLGLDDFNFNFIKKNVKGTQKTLNTCCILRDVKTRYS